MLAGPHADYAEIIEPFAANAESGQMETFTMNIPFTRPMPPSLRLLGSEIAELEESGIFTNYGPVNARFEDALTRDMFGGNGACLTACNATIALMLAIRCVVARADRIRPRAAADRSVRYALMPSFTFAAAAHAADWAGLTPLFCDVDETDWAASAVAEEELIDRYGAAIAVIVPYATFGNCIDLARYERLSERTGIPVVVDAAASLGSLDQTGEAFGARCPFPVVFSMHATKTFSTAEGGVIHSTDLDLLEELRIMGNFGFGMPRSATMAGLNSKLSEIGALLALARLRDFEAVVRHREELSIQYRQSLPGWSFQQMRGVRCAYQFMPVLLPDHLDNRREALLADLKARGIGAASYFSPHVAAQPFFEANGVSGPLPVTEQLSRRMLSLPIWDGMTTENVVTVCNTVLDVCSRIAPPASVPLAPRRRTYRVRHPQPVSAQQLEVS